MSLSDKKVRDLSNNPIDDYYWGKDVKAFIKELKKELTRDGFGYNSAKDIIRQIDKLAGEDLIE